MGNPHRQTDLSALRRAKNESSQPVGQVTSGEEEADEPEELSDVAMSDQNSQTEVQDEESSGGLSLEAKAGLTLVCLLAATFGYMVWQKWKEMENEKVAQEQHASGVQEEKSSEKPPHGADLKPEIELVGAGPQTEPPAEPPTVTSNPGETGKPSLPPTMSLGNAEQETLPGENPFSNSDPEQPTRTPANIPTLKVPEETASNSAAEIPDDFNPFGDEPEPASETAAEKTASTATAEVTPTETFNPFGAEVETEAPATKKAAESFPKSGTAPTEPDPFAADVEPKPAASEPDPFATAPNPFDEPRTEPATAETEAEAPTLDFGDSDPLPEEKPKPVKTAAADPVRELNSEPDPFAEEPAEKHPLDAKPATPVNVTPGDSFQEPLPLLEPVPDQKSKPPARNPFGEFESVPAGAAQASSVTQVSPDPSRPKRSGTLAALDASSATNTSSNNSTSPFEGNPFAKPQPAPVKHEFKLNPDGTYEIRQGDSYWLISRKAYGTSRYFQALSEYNRKIIPNPQEMKAGKKIVIPPAQELERKLSHLIPETPAAPAPSIVMASAEQDAGFFTDAQGNPMYRVQENDTLTGISQRHLGRSSRWIQIYELNRDKLSNPNQLKIGTTLKLPRDASRVRIVRGQ